MEAKEKIIRLEQEIDLLKRKIEELERWIRNFEYQKMMEEQKKYR